MNNVSFNREQFNDTIKERLAYFMTLGILRPKRVNYQKPKEDDYQKPKKVNYPSPL